MGVVQYIGCTIDTQYSCRRTALICISHSQTPWQGCQTTLHCALSRELEPSSKDAPQPALYYDDCQPTAPASTATDESVAFLLWGASERYTGLSASLHQ